MLFKASLLMNKSCWIISIAYLVSGWPVKDICIIFVRVLFALLTDGQYNKQCRQWWWDSFKPSKGWSNVSTWKSHIPI